MLHEEKKLLTRKLFWFLLVVIGCIICIKAFKDLWEWFTLLFLIELTIVAFFFGSLSLSCKSYKYKNYRIIAYSGWFHHYVKVNEEMVDEHNTLITFTPITLESTLDSGEKIFVRISTLNSITLKINDKLYR